MKSASPLLDVEQEPRSRRGKRAVVFLLFFFVTYCAAAVLKSTVWSFALWGPYECQPLEIHIGVTEYPTTMRVTWRTRGDACPTSVYYAHEEQRDNWERAVRQAYGVGYAGDKSMLCGGTAAEFDFDLQLHTVVMTGLEPNQPYLYSLPHDSRRFSFTASKPAGDDSSFVFFVFGDMGMQIKNGHKYEGAGIVQSAMLDEIEHGVPDLMLSVGDISYADGDPYVWEAFMRGIEPFTSGILWVPGFGNHEYDLSADDAFDPWGIKPYQPEWSSLAEGDSEGECGLHVYWRFPFGERFTPLRLNRHQSFLPVPPHGEAFPPFWHSFDQGLVHFVTLSTEHDAEPGSPQLAWLERDLASVNRCKTPFIVATGHRPFNAPKRDSKDFNTGIGYRKLLEDVLIRHNVDVYISGHVHAYYRTCEARAGECVEPGTGLVSMVLGSGGHRLDTIEREDFSFEELHLELTWGFGKFIVEGNDFMDFLFLEAATGRVLDTHRFTNRVPCA